MSESIARIDDPVVAISINRSYRDGLRQEELYDRTKGTWKVSKVRADKAHYAFAVYRGVIKEVYQIDEWLPSGSSEFTRQFGNRDDGRWEFEGRLAPENIRKKYRGKRMPDRFWGFPIRYNNC